MLLILLAYLGGALTILSPCILPVLPFVFARADRPFLRNGLSVLLGVATGLLWAPCAGPILGIILTGAALSGATLGTSLLLLAYALGAATSLALALLIGGRGVAAMKRPIRARP